MSSVKAMQKKAAQSEETSSEELEQLAEHSIELARLVARNQAAPEALLRKLGSHRDATVRKWVAAHPSTPGDVLGALAQQFPEQLLTNPILDFLLLENPAFMDSLPTAAIRAFMRRRSTPVEMLRQGARHSDEGVVLAVAQNPETPEDALRALEKRFKDGPVRAAITARRQAEPDPAEADELFWQAVCSRVSEYRLKSVERRVFAELLEGALAHGDSAAWLTRLAQAKDLEEDPANFSDVLGERNTLVLEALLARKDLPASVLLPLLPRALLAGRILQAKLNGQHASVLRALAESEDEEVRAAVAGNSATPLSVIEKLSHAFLKDDSWAWEVGVAAAKNKVTPPHVLEQLATSDDDRVLKAVAKNPKTPLATLEKLSKSQDISVLTSLFLNAGAPAELLKPLIRKKGKELSLENEVVRLLKRGFDLPYLIFIAHRALAKNPKCPPDMLNVLSQHRDWDVRESVAENPNCDEATFSELSTRKDWLVLNRILRNPNCAPSVLDKFSKRRSYEVASFVADNPNSPPAALERLAKHRDDIVRVDVALNPSITPKAAKHLADDNDDFVRCCLARNSSCPEEVLARLSKDSSSETRLAVAANPNCPDGLLLEIALREDPSLKRLGLKRIDEAALECLAGSKIEGIRRIVAESKVSSESILHRLAGDSDEFVRQYVAGNPSTPGSVLKRLVRDKDDSVRRAIADNPSTPVAVLEKLARDKEYRVRRSVAGNPFAPEAALEVLAWDKKDWVRKMVPENPNCPEALLIKLSRNPGRQYSTFPGGWFSEALSKNPGVGSLMESFFQGKNLNPRIFHGLVANPEAIPFLEPHFPDVLRLLRGRPLKGEKG